MTAASGLKHSVGSPQTIIIPRSFGENPTGAIINEAVFNAKDLPELPAVVQREWVQRRAKMTEMAEIRSK